MLQEWQTGDPTRGDLPVIRDECGAMYRWKRSLDQGLKEPGELVPKSQALGVQKLVGLAPDLKRLKIALLRDFWGPGIEIPSISSLFGSISSVGSLSYMVPNYFSR